MVIPVNKLVTLNTPSGNEAFLYSPNNYINKLIKTNQIIYPTPILLQRTNLFVTLPTGTHNQPTENQYLLHRFKPNLP